MSTALNPLGPLDFNPRTDLHDTVTAEPNDSISKYADGFYGDAGSCR